MKASTLTACLLLVSLVSTFIEASKKCTKDSECSANQCCMKGDNKTGKCRGFLKPGELCLKSTGRGSQCPRCRSTLKCQMMIPNPPIGNCVNA